MMPARRISARIAQRAFTLVELLTVIVIGAIGAAIAYPMLSDALASQRLRASGTDLMSSLLLARSEAIKRNAQVQVQPKVGTDWTSGWSVSPVDTGEQLDAKNALGLRVTVHNAPATFVYEGNGRLTVAGVTRVALVDADGRATARCVTVNPSGEPTLTLATGQSC